MTIRAILLDADGVVQTTTPDFMAQLRGLVGDAERADAFLEAAFEAEGRALIGEGDFRTDLLAVMERFGVVRSIDDVMRAWASIAPVPGVLELVASLRAAGHACYVASNQQVYRATHMSETLGYRDAFDGEFYSYALGARKPDPRFFSGVLAALDVEPSSLLFVDDHMPNVEAARTLSIRAIQFDARAHDAPGAALRDSLAPFGVETAPRFH